MSCVHYYKRTFILNVVGISGFHLRKIYQKKWILPTFLLKDRNYYFTWSDICLIKKVNSLLSEGINFHQISHAVDSIGSIDNFFKISLNNNRLYYFHEQLNRVEDLKTNQYLLNFGDLNKSGDFALKLIKTKKNKSFDLMRSYDNFQVYQHVRKALDFQDHELYEARSYYEILLKFSDKYWFAAFRLGILYHRQSSFEKAQSFYVKALLLNPDNQELLFNLGLIFEAKMDYRYAIACYIQLTNIPLGRIHLKRIYTLTGNELADFSKKTIKS